MADWIDRISIDTSTVESDEIATEVTTTRSAVPFVSPKTLSYSTIGVAAGAVLAVINGAVPGMPRWIVLVVAGTLAILSAAAFVSADRVRHPDNFGPGNRGLYFLSTLLNVVLLFGCIAGLGGLSSPVPGT